MLCSRDVHPRVTDLGTLRAAAGESHATGINRLGQVVGYSTAADGAVHRGFRPARMGGRTLLEAKELRLEESFRNRRAVDGDERPGRSRTRVVEGLR